MLLKLCLDFFMLLRLCLDVLMLLKLCLDVLMFLTAKIVLFATDLYLMVVHRLWHGLHSNGTEDVLSPQKSQN